MKPRLQEQGWYIAEVDCVNVEDIEDCGTRLLRELILIFFFINHIVISLRNPTQGDS